MGQVFQIFKREFCTYFVSPIAYIVITIFLVVSGWFFFSTFFIYNQASMRGFFSMMPFIFAFVIPAITMRLFSEEISVGSHEMLLTLPVTMLQAVLGKYLAAMAFIAVMLLPTIMYPLSISFLGRLDWGPVLGGYIGTLFLGGAFCAVGLFASSLTRNQIIAFIIGLTICFGLLMIDRMLFFLPESLVGFFSYLGVNTHFQNTAKGVVSTRDLLYLLSVTFIALYGSRLSMEERC